MDWTWPQGGRHGLDSFAKRIALSEMAIDCETQNYPGLLAGDIFTGVREGDPRPVVKLDNRRMSDRAAEAALFVR